ncbi:MAG: YdeI/OmpD-associated family protein [Blastocatellia bacterium]
MSRQKFKGKLRPMGPGGAWTNLKVPIDIESVYGSRARLSVRGTINGFEFRTSIFPDGNGGFHLMVNKAMQEGAKAKQGDEVEVAFEKDNGNREVTVPRDLNKAVRDNPEAKTKFKTLSPSRRKDFVEWVTGAKQAETRARRVAKAVAMIADGKSLK